MRDARLGYRWERRQGCQCKTCPWKGNCRGEDWPHWIEVSDGEESEEAEKAGGSFGGD